MSDRGARTFVQDILTAGQRISEYIEGLSYEAFRDDYKTQDAVIRNLEIIGEASRNIDGNVRDRFPELPWKAMAGMRDRLIHAYFGVNLEIVWAVIHFELPALIPLLEKLVHGNALD